MAKEGNWSVKGLSYASGILCGADCLIMGVLMMAGVEFLWWNRTIMPFYQSIFPGFSATPGGVLIGVVEALVIGAVGGAVIAWLYNACKNRWG